MSYSIYLTVPACPTCGREDGPDSLPSMVTWNLSPIFHLALSGVTPVAGVTEEPWGLKILKGRTGAETLDELRVALARMREPSMHEQFVVLEPENKWGDLEGAISIIERLRDAAEAYPKGVWDIE